jgi:hypothetical protein
MTIASRRNVRDAFWFVSVGSFVLRWCSLLIIEQPIKPLDKMTAADVKAILAQPGGAHLLLTNRLMFDKVTAVLEGKSVNH